MSLPTLLDDFDVAEQHFTIDEISLIHKISKSTIRREYGAGALKASFRLDRAPRFPASEVKRWLSTLDANAA